MEPLEGFAGKTLSAAGWCLGKKLRRPSRRWEFNSSLPDVGAKLKAPKMADEKFEVVVKSAQDAAVLGLVY
jgi:hypothetical protein